MYDYEYRVSNRQQRTTIARRTVVFYQQGNVTLSLPLLTGLDNATTVRLLGP
jgi:hypothetical protein